MQYGGYYKLRCGSLSTYIEVRSLLLSRPHRNCQSTVNRLSIMLSFTPEPYWVPRHASRIGAAGRKSGSSELNRSVGSDPCDDFIGFPHFDLSTSTHKPFLPQNAEEDNRLHPLPRHWARAASARQGEWIISPPDHPTGASTHVQDYYESLEESLQGGVTLVQVREKNTDTGEVSAVMYD